MGQYLLVLLIAVTINFLLPRLMPGNPLALIAGVDVGLLSPEQRGEIAARFGLDQSLFQQYLQYWGNLLSGDFGFSYRSGRPITELIGERLPWTLLLTGASLTISAIVGIVAGAVSAWRRGGRYDLTTLTSMIALESMPPFWLGMLLIAGFAVTLNVLPSFGAETAAAGLTGWARVRDIAEHALLPVATLSIVSIPGVYMTMRYSMLEVLGEDFIRTARAKGVAERTVLFRHVIRNALAPVLTVLALRLGYAFGGTVVIETVFSYPGLGRLVFEAVGGRDYPVMQAAFLVFTLAVLVANLAADLVYPIVDPRTRAS
jgi:peptide/nickel transport system permease protein